MPATAKKCPRCKYFESDPGMKYCGQCHKWVKEEMELSGYLTPAPESSKNYRPSDARENVYETKFGRDGGRVRFI